MYNTDKYSQKNFCGTAENRKNEKVNPVNLSPFMVYMMYVYVFITIVYNRFLKLSDTTNQSLELTMDSQDLTEVTELTLSPPARTSSVCNEPSSVTEACRYVITLAATM